MKRYYSVIILAVFLIVLGGAFTYRYTADHKPALPEETTGQVEAATKPQHADSVDVNELFTLTNNDRAKVGLPRLEISSDLQKSATDKCNDMVTKNYYEHDAPDGTTWQSFIDKYTTYEKAGENVTMFFTNASAGAANTEFMNSETHKANILNANYTLVNFAVCHTDNYKPNNYPAIFVVEHFIEPQVVIAKPIKQELPPTTCSDGSYSWSTGPGTCSHHDGIDHYN